MRSFATFGKPLKLYKTWAPKSAAHGNVTRWLCQFPPICTLYGSDPSPLPNSTGTLADRLRARLTNATVNDVESAVASRIFNNVREALWRPLQVAVSRTFQEYPVPS